MCAALSLSMDGTSCLSLLYGPLLATDPRERATPRHVEVDPFANFPRGGHGLADS